MNRDKHIKPELPIVTNKKPLDVEPLIIDKHKMSQGKNKEHVVKLTRDH